MDEGRVANARLQELTTAHARDLTFLLRRLVDEGFLESHGDRRGAWYTVAELPKNRKGNAGRSPRKASDFNLRPGRRLVNWHAQHPARTSASPAPHRRVLSH